MHQTRLRLGQLLVDARILTPEQLEQVLALQRVDGRRLGTLLVEIGLVTETQLTQILSQQLSVPWVSLYHIDFSRALLSLVPREIAEKFCLVPIYVRPVRGLGDTLYVAMDNPMNEEALVACTSSAGLPTRAMIAAPSDIRKAIRLYYAGVRSAPRAVRSTPPRPPPTAHRPIDVEALEEIESQPVEDSSPPTAGPSASAKPGAASDKAALEAFLTPSGSVKAAASVATSAPSGTPYPATGASRPAPASDDRIRGAAVVSVTGARASERGLAYSAQPEGPAGAVGARDERAGRLSEASPGPLADAVAAASSQFAEAIPAAASVEEPPSRAVAQDVAVAPSVDASQPVENCAEGEAPPAVEPAAAVTPDEPRPTEAARGAYDPPAHDQAERLRAAQAAFGGFAGEGSAVDSSGSAPPNERASVSPDASAAGGSGSSAQPRRSSSGAEDLAAAFAMGAAASEPPRTTSESPAAGARGSSWDVSASRASSKPSASQPADDAPEVEAHEIELPRRPRGKRLSLTLLDGTTIALGALPPKRSRPAPRGELSGIEVIAMLKAAYRTRPGKEGAPPEELRGEKILAALLALLLRKHLITEDELVEEVKKL